MAADYSGIGTTYRVEAESAKGRMLFFAAVLVLAHLLDIKPSEISAVGFKININNPAVVYGAISLVFGYYLSKFLSNIEKGESFHPLQVGSKRIRANLRSARRTLFNDKKTRRNGLSPKKLKNTTRQMIIFGDIVLLPYRLLGVVFVIIAIILSAGDLYNLITLIWTTSHLVGDIRNSF